MNLLMRLFEHVHGERRREALRAFAERCPRDVFESLLHGRKTSPSENPEARDLEMFIFYGPERPIRGEVLPLTIPAPKGALRDIRHIVHLIYLSPSLEDEPRELVLGVIAHETAHAWLRHDLL